MVSFFKKGGSLAKSIKKGPLTDFQTKEKTLWFMFLRALVTTFLLIITLIYQIKDSSFIGPQELLPIYSLIGFTFLITIIFSLLIDRIKNLTYFSISQIAYDILFITTLIYITGTQQAIFTFLYFFTIAFAAFLFFRSGALYTAAFSSICFSTLLILDPIPSSETHLLTLFFNNVAFFLVAILSGYLSEQFKQFGIKLKEEQESVQELEDLNKTIIDNMKSGLLTTDLKNRIIYFNKAAEKITGLSLSHIYEKNVFDIFPELKKYWIKKIPSSKDLPKRQNFKFKKSITENLILGFSLSPLRDASRSKMGYILIFEDLTNIIEMEQHLQRSDKLAAVGKLAAGIAHEIRNPLASVSGSIEVLKRDLDVKDENKKLMDIILKETDRLNNLVGEFLDYVRPSEYKREVFDIHKTIEEIILAISMNKSVSKNIKTDFNPGKQHFYIHGNKEKIKQVFWNLMLNACQAMPEGGTVKVYSYQKEGQLYIDIADTGEGIPEEIINKIFDPFFTTKPSGTGLGLSMVHKIVEAHQGRISVSSKKGEGTSFTLMLPIEEHKKGGEQYVRQS